MALLDCLSLASGYLAAAASNGLLTLGSACAQVLQGAIPPFQLNLSRYFFQVMICGSLSLIRREGVLIEQKLIPNLLLTALLSNVSNTTYYTASALLPLGTFLIIDNLTQIINSCILDKLIFNKVVSPLKCLCIVFMIPGIILIIQPDFIFNGVSIGAFDPIPRVEALGNYTGSNLTATGVSGQFTGSSVEDTVLLGSILAIIAGVASTTRGAIVKLKLSTVSTGTLGLWIGICSVLLSTILMFYVDTIYLQFNDHQVLLLLGHAIGAALSSILKIYSQQVLFLVSVAMMENSKLVLNFILQYTLLRSIQPGKRNALEVVGAILVNTAIIGTVIIDFRANKIKKEKELIEDDFKHQ